MDTLFWYTGALCWAIVCLGLAGIICLVSWISFTALLNTVAQTIRVTRRGMPRSEWKNSFGTVWWYSFLHANTKDCIKEIKRAIGPITPWVKGEDEHRRYTAKPKTWEKVDDEKSDEAKS